jgi:hypothetical protein
VALTLLNARDQLFPRMDFEERWIISLEREAALRRDSGNGCTHPVRRV